MDVRDVCGNILVYIYKVFILEIKNDGITFRLITAMHPNVPTTSA
jgi:hypothetical protein